MAQIEPHPQTDPRERITPDAFVVAPHLLGLPLARPWRRGVAMSLDLLLLAVLTSLGSTVLSFAIAAAAFWLAARGKRESPVRRADVMPLRVIGTVFLLIGLVLVGVRVFRPQIERGVAGALASGRLGEGGAAVAHAIRMGQDLAAVQATSTEVEARAAVARAEESMRRLDITPEAIRERFTGMAAEAPPDRPWIAEALLDAAERLPAAEDAAPLVRPLTPPELATAYADAAAAGDSIAADSLRTRLALSLGADTLRSLEARIQGLRTEVDSLREEREPEAGGGIVAYLRGLLDDLGVGFGWSTLYFTLFLAVWRGQTPGKRLLGIRVVRLNGKPITWWASFERFGGYAAGLATGLLGFLQIFWDRNRQAIHDKIMETVVVRERGVPETHPATAVPAAEAVPAPATTPDVLSGSGVPATEPAPDEQTGS
ncbi:hypothetical protein BH24GEM3_BH24GEM3_16320 [soil metagenome]